MNSWMQVLIINAISDLYTFWTSHVSFQLNEAYSKDPSLYLSFKRLI